MNAGAMPLSLGPRTMRAETAAIVGGALVLARLEAAVDTLPERFL